MLFKFFLSGCLLALVTGCAEMKPSVLESPVSVGGGVVILDVKVVDSWEVLEKEGKSFGFPLEVVYREGGRKKVQKLREVGDGNEHFRYAGKLSHPRLHALDGMEKGKAYDGPTIVKYYLRMSNGRLVRTPIWGAYTAEVKMLSEKEVKELAALCARSAVQCDFEVK